jgi:transcriptional regulator of acetoin/glycerol metabolism
MRADVGEKQITSGALSALVDYDWPGNVRELASVLYRACMASSESAIRAEDITAGTGPGTVKRAAPLGAEQAHVLLREHHGNISAAARAAGVPRSTFRSWLVRSEVSEVSKDGGLQNSPTTDTP